MTEQGRAACVRHPAPEPKLPNPIGQVSGCCLLLLVNGVGELCCFLEQGFLKTAKEELPMRMTQRQILVLTLLANKNPDGTCLDLDQLLDLLSEEHSLSVDKPCLQFTLRTLRDEGLIENLPREKRRGRSRRVLAITELGLALLGRDADKSVVTYKLLYQYSTPERLQLQQTVLSI